MSELLAMKLILHKIRFVHGKVIIRCISGVLRYHLLDVYEPQKVVNHHYLMVVPELAPCWTSSHLYGWHHWPLSLNTFHAGSPPVVTDRLPTTPLCPTRALVLKIYLTFSKLIRWPLLQLASVAMKNVHFSLCFWEHAGGKAFYLVSFQALTVNCTCTVNAWASATP